MAFLDGLAEWLGDNVPTLTYGVEEGGNVFVDWLPAEPDEAIALITTPGQIEPDSKLPYDMPAFQVLTRGVHGSLWGVDRIAEVYSWLHGFRNAILPDGTRVIYVLAEQSSAMRLSDDENGRPRWSQDYKAEILSETQWRTTKI